MEIARSNMAPHVAKYEGLIDLLADALVREIEAQLASEELGIPPAAQGGDTAHGAPKLAADARLEAA